MTCNCVSKFQQTPPPLDLPLDPQLLLCQPPQDLVRAFSTLKVSWNSYLQQFLLSVINHNPASPIFRVPITKVEGKKKRRQPMSPAVKERIIERLCAGVSVGVIAKQLNVPPRSVSDQKYFLQKAGHGTPSTDRGADPGR